MRQEAGNTNHNQKLNMHTVSHRPFTYAISVGH